MHFKLIEKTVIVTRGTESIEYNLANTISRNSKDNNDVAKTFTILEAYLNYKGESFKSELWGAMQHSMMLINNSITGVDMNRLPLGIVHPILDLFDIKEVHHFVQNIYGLKAPSTLKEEFDIREEADKRITRARTYTRNDYLGLAALSVIAKAVIGPIGHFMSMHASTISSKHKEYNVFNFIRTHSIFNTPPFVKLLGLIKEIINSPTTDDERKIRVIEKGVGTSEIPYLILAVAFIQKVSIINLLDDTDSKHIVTNIHGFVTNRNRVKNDVGNAIRSKKALSSIDDEGEESLIEAYRTLSDLTVGSKVELDWAVSDFNINISQLPIEIDRKVFGDALMFTTILNERELYKEQVYMISWILKKLLPPEGFEHLRSERIVELLALCFAYLWAMDLKSLALLMVSYEKIIPTDTVYINSTTNRNKITKDLKELLAKEYPYERFISGSGDTIKTANLVEDSIGKAANSIFNRSLQTTATDSYIIEAVGSIEASRSIPSDLKIQMARMVLLVEDINYLGKI